MLFVRSIYSMYATNGRISNSSTVFLTGRSDRLSINTSRDRGDVCSVEEQNLFGISAVGSLGLLRTYGKIMVNILVVIFSY